MNRAPLPQRRWATALFFDLTNFSSYTTSHDLEETHRTVHRILERARECVVEQGGCIDKFYGDGMLAVFGLQKSRDEEPTRALRAAVCMIEATRDSNPELQGRVGLATGLVLLGPLGSEQGQHQTVIGTPVNLAQRLSSAAPGGEVWMDEMTARLVLQARLKPLAPKVFKGFLEPHRVFAFRGWGSDNQPFFGREKELKQVMGWIRDAQQGGGRVAVISGPIGAGKSYLVKEALRRSGNVRSLELPSLELGTPLREALQKAFTQSLGTTPEAILEGLALPDLDQRVLTFMFGIETERPAPPEDLENIMLQSFRRLLELLAQQKPLVVVVRSSALDHPLSAGMIDTLRTNPISGLTVIVLRRLPAVGADLVLGPLPRHDADAYLKHLNPDLTPQACKSIYNESGGYPLALRFLALSDDPGISLMAAFQSRLDKLQPLHRKLLLYIALGQPSSWPELLGELSRTDVRPVVDDLIQEGYVVVESGARGQISLRVADPLLKRAARLFLSNKERKGLHQAYWKWLRERSEAHMVAQAAEHARHAELDHEAALAYLRAGDLEKAAGLFRSAEQYYQSGLALLTEEHRYLARLRLSRLHLDGGSPELALAWLEQENSIEAWKISGLARALLHQTDAARIHLQRYLQLRPTDPEAVLALIALESPAVRLARLATFQPETSELKVEHMRLQAETLAELGRLDEAAATMRAVYDCYLENHQESRAAEAALALSGYHWMSEKLPAASEWADRAVDHARKAHPGMTTSAWSIRAALWLDQGKAHEASEALDQAERNVVHARTPDERARIHAIRMRFALETGRLHDAVALGEEVYRNEPHPWLAANLALAHALAGDRQADERSLELQHRHSEQASPPSRMLFALAEALRTWRAGGDPVPAFKKARRYIRSSGPYLNYLTLVFWGFYLMDRKPQKALVLASYLQRRASASGFVVLQETARILRAEVALARGEPYEHLLHFHASLKMQEHWRRALLQQAPSVSKRSHSFSAYGILGAVSGSGYPETLMQHRNGPTRRNP